MEKTNRRFEEIPVWMKARELCRETYSATKLKPFCYDHGLRDQIQRAAVSVLSNIAEGVERGSTTELISFLFIAKGSVGEVRAQLYVAEDQAYVSATDAERLRNVAQEISCQLNNWIKALQKPDTPQGPRYRRVRSDADKRFEVGQEWLKQHVENLRKGEQGKRNDAEGHQE